MNHDQKIINGDEISVSRPVKKKWGGDDKLKYRDVNRKLLEEIIRNSKS